MARLAKVLVGAHVMPLGGGGVESVACVAALGDAREALRRWPARAVDFVPCSARDNRGAGPDEAAERARDMTTRSEGGGASIVRKASSISHDDVIMAMWQPWHYDCNGATLPRRTAMLIDMVT